MENNIDELIVNIRELEELISFFQRYQIPFTNTGFNYLINEVQSLKIQLAKLEADERKQLRKLITNN